MTKIDPIEWGNKSCPFWDTTIYGNYPCNTCHYADWTEMDGEHFAKCTIYVRERTGEIYG